MPLNGEYEPSTAQFVRDQVELYESSGGTQGTTLGVLVTRDSYAVVASAGGAPKHPVWYHNAVADPRVELQDGPVRQDMLAREVTGDEKAMWWARAVEAFPPYAEYQKNTDREIPVLVLEPAAQAH
ncbi:nitroreductase family deazaflavin-dependent oxidoreductase [Streptomyces sp. NPDC050759]|uniref:nitroreductase family deazaflavin-dependent oxidoreductase n=1 Tax=Streptomyces sp. NPDC050759 TaxID=3365635 RepID=UPI003792AB87